MHLEVCDHEVLLVMSSVMQATGWRIVHICLVHSVVKLQLARIFLPDVKEGCSHTQEFYAEYHVVGGTAVFQGLVEPMICFPFQAFKYDVYSLISGSHWFHRFVSLTSVSVLQDFPWLVTRRTSPGDFRHTGISPIASRRFLPSVATHEQLCGRDLPGSRDSTPMAYAS